MHIIVHKCCKQHSTHSSDNLLS